MRGGGGSGSGGSCVGLRRPFVAVFVLCAVTYSCMYAVLTSQSHSQEAAQLRSKLDDITAQMNYMRYEMNITQRKLNLQTHRVNLAFTRGKAPFPWERCMRFHFRRDCPDPENTELPPCQIEILKEMAHVFIQALEKAGVEYYITYGTLLGALRNNELVPWTGDVDFVLKQDLFKTIEQTLKKTKVLQDNGYYFFIDPDYPDLGRMCITEAATRFSKWQKIDPEVHEYYNYYPFVDIYQLYDRGNDRVAIKHGPGCIFATSTVYPLTRIKLYDDDTWAPANSSKYLSQLYGPDWKSPPPANMRSGHGAYSDACKPEWQ